MNRNQEDMKIHRKKLKRFEGEVAKFQKKWPEILEKGDPFYNPNFPIDKAPFTLG